MHGYTIGTIKGMNVLSWLSYPRGKFIVEQVTLPLSCNTTLVQLAICIVIAGAYATQYTTNVHTSSESQLSSITIYG